jgi:membrane protein implicated in regulation of membrane protease activity
MPAWLIWLIVAGALAAAETVSLTLVLVMFAGGAGAAAITAALGAPVFLQFVVALLATGALLGLVRPVARRHLTIGDPARTGADALVGMDAIVLSKVDGFGGLVRLNGAEWSARAADPEQVIAAGTVVHVVEIDGATAVVWAAAS